MFHILIPENILDLKIGLISEDSSKDIEKILHSESESLEREDLIA